MSGLSEFVLARIAEDEEAARWPIELRERWGDDPVDHEYGWAWHTSHRETGGRGSQFLAGAPSPDRVLAECEAKRRIVEDFQILHRDYQETHTPSLEARRFQALVAVGRLASVYADHPDYREEWRP